MFDVDYTLSLPRQPAKPEMMDALQRLRTMTGVAVVSGSDVSKTAEQLAFPGKTSEPLFPLLCRV